MERALVLLCFTLCFSLIPSARSCAFPPQGCDKPVCDALNLKNFGAILDPDAFDANDVSQKGDWSKLGYEDLGYYYGIYNPLYNGGVYDKTKKAVDDAAPSVNYFSVITTMGTYKKTAVTLSACCNLCRTTSNCNFYSFNPNLNKVYSANGTLVSTSFYTSGQGKCYLLIKGGYTFSSVNGQCHNSSNMFERTTKPVFYGGICSPLVSDDPHFLGNYGTRFDFNGEVGKSFCLVADKELHINALLGGYADPGAGEKGIRTWMKQLGFVWMDAAGRHSLQLVARKGKEQKRAKGFLVAALLDGVPLNLPSPGVSVVKGMMNLTFDSQGKTGPYDMDYYTLQLGSLLDLSFSLRVAHPKLQTPTDAEVHFNLMFNDISTSPAVHGVLGQTYRSTAAQELKAVKYSMLTQILGAPVQADGSSGKGFLDGEPKDYITSSVTAPDCKFAPMLSH